MDWSPRPSLQSGDKTTPSVLLHLNQYGRYLARPTEGYLVLRTCTIDRGGMWVNHPVEGGITKSIIMCLGGTLSRKTDLRQKDKSETLDDGPERRRCQFFNFPYFVGWHSDHCPEICPSSVWVTKIQVMSGLIPSVDYFDSNPVFDIYTYIYCAPRGYILKPACENRSHPFFGTLNYFWYIGMGIFNLGFWRFLQVFPQYIFILQTYFSILHLL